MPKKFTLQEQDLPKLGKSALISVLAVVAVYLLTLLFPDQDFSTLKTAILTGVSAWIINTVRVWTE